MRKFRHLLKSFQIVGLSVLLFTGTFSVITLNSRAYAISGSAIASLTNGERAARGLAALAWSGALSSSAAMKAQDMCAKGYWAHTGPNGATGWTFMSQAGYRYTTAGENLAKDFSSDGGVVAGWVASPGHLANIINPTFRDIGVSAISCVFQGANTTIVVAHYGTTVSASQPVAKPVPAPVRTPAPVPTPTPKPATRRAAPTPTATSQNQPVATLETELPKEKPAESPAAPIEVTKPVVINKPGFGADLWKMTLAHSDKIVLANELHV